MPSAPLSWVRPGQGQFSPDSRKGHSQPDWPNLAKQSRVFHSMCRHAGFRWGGAGRREISHGSGACSSCRGERLSLLFCFVLCIPLTCIVAVPVPFVCCSVKLPLSRLTGFCLLLSNLLCTPAGGGVAAWRFCCRPQLNYNTLFHLGQFEVLFCFIPFAVIAFT